MKSARQWFAVLGLGAALVACKTITEDLPESAQNPSGPNPTVVVVPVALPTPNPNPGPTPTPNANPNPNPNPTPTPAPNPTPDPPTSQGCNLPPSSNPHQCPRTSPVFQDDVEWAVAKVQRERPDIVSGNKVKNVNAYYAAIVANVRSRGYCAKHDQSGSGHHELAIKNTNAFNEQWHLMTSSSTVRTGEGAYRATCRPAWF